MKTALEHACPQCKRPCAEELVCALCGNVLRREQRFATVLVSPSPSAPIAQPSLASELALLSEKPGEPRAGREPWFYLVLGVATAPLFAWTPLLRSMGWFLE